MIDWKRVRREAKKLKLFKGHYDPTTIPYEQQCWNVTLSIRNTGKTTAYILLGMIIYRLYGQRIEYCRLMPDDIRPRDHSHFFDSIISYGYIDILTDGKYNTCKYKGGFWYYARTEDGQVVEQSEDPFMHTFAVRKSMDMKSNYTSNSSFIIFDEFIDPTKYYNDDFVLLCDCISTIFRQRVGWVNLLANTIDRQSVWFKEMCISREVATMQQGESRRIEHDGLTPVLVNILPAVMTDAKIKHNHALFNFKNSKLEAITGTADGWSMRVYNRLPRGVNNIIFERIYFNVDSFIVRGQIIDNDKLGIVLQVVETPRTYDEIPEDAVIYTTEPIRNNREIYLYNSPDGLTAFIYKLVRMNRVYFGNNEAGILFDAFNNHK